MKLFNEYYNSELQYLLNLFCLERPFTKSEAEILMKKEYVSAPYNDHLEEWVLRGIFEKTDDGKYKVCRGLKSFAAPLNDLEREYLTELCRTTEAKLFLSEQLRAKFTVAGAQSIFDFIEQKNARGRTIKLGLSADDFQNLLKAISEKKRIRYKYRTKRDSDWQPTSEAVIPYRIEYNVFDGRWQLILYKKDDSHPVEKIPFENLKDICIMDKHGLSERTIRDIITEELAPERVILHIEDKKNAKERCFFMFEGMMEMEASKLEKEDEYELSFRYFQWDEDSIVRKLLYLGEFVTVQKPKGIITKLICELKNAIQHYTGQDVE